MANTSKKFGNTEPEAIEEYRAIIDMYSAETIPPEVKYENVSIYADRLQRMLTIRDISASELARTAGVSAEVVSRIVLKKEKTVNIERARLFAAILNCTPHYLLGLTEKENVRLIGDGVEISSPISPARRSWHVLSACLENCHDEEFVRCVAEIVERSKSNPNILSETKTMLIAAHKCDPSKFNLIMPASWLGKFDES